ncbi:MAG TPA: hemolysin family protein [Polyangiales bacterium]
MGESLQGPSSLWVVVILCVIVGGLCAALDGALRALGDTRMRAARDDGGERGKLAARYLANPRLIHTRMLTGRVVSLTAAAALAALLGGRWGGSAGGSLATFGVALAYGLLAETATRFASRRATGVALPLLARMRPLELLFAPFAFPLVAFGGLIDRVLPPRPEDDPERVTEADVSQLIEQGEEVGSITQDHAAMLRAVLDFHDMTAREIMVPRTQMVAIEIETPIDQVIDLVIRTGHSRYPVYRERADQVVGVLYAKDYFGAQRDAHAAGRQVTLAELVRKDVFFVAETHKIGALLKEMQSRRVHLAVVTDEFGGTAGVITLEDILEEIVGDIQDEHDREEPEVRAVGSGRYEADASVSLHHLEEVVGVPLKPRDSSADSLGGLLVETAGRVPAPGERIELGGLVFTVVDSDARHVERVEIARFNPAHDAAE